MATGENFKRIGRNTDIKRLKGQLQEVKNKWSNYMNINNTRDNPNWNYGELAKIEKEVELAEYELYCAEYEDNRRRNWG